jgi:hypothetical protein
VSGEREREKVIDLQEKKKFFAVIFFRNDDL